MKTVLSMLETGYLYVISAHSHGIMPPILSRSGGEQLGASLKMQTDWFPIAMTTIGVIAGVAGTIFAGYFKAKREGFTKITLAQMVQTKEFYDDVMQEIQNLRNENVALRRAVLELEQRNTDHGWNEEKLDGE